MEVFLHNLPTDLSGDGLKDQLEPFMRRLKVSHYLCDKPKRKRFGTITFLSRDQGDRFLAIHGEQNVYSGVGKPRNLSRLQILGSDVFCKRSNRPPQDFALKTLQHEVEERENESVLVEEDFGVSFSLTSSSCGYCTFMRDKVVYIPEVDWSISGSVRFTKRNVIVKMDNQTMMRFALNTIVELVWFSDGSLTFTLSSVPCFFELRESSFPTTLLQKLAGININSERVKIDVTRHRVGSLSKEHADVVGQCLVYQLKVLPFQLQSNMIPLQELEITTTNFDLTHAPFSRHLTPIHSQLSNLRRDLANFIQRGSLPFGILFQLQALAYNAYLPPETILNLVFDMQWMFQHKKPMDKQPFSVEAVRKLFELIDWPLPLGDPNDFSVDSLLQLVKENEKEIREGSTHRDGLYIPNQNMARIHRAMVSPSRITLHGPEMEPNNRILRKFPNHHDYFIRVQFCDENGQDLYFGPRVNNEQIFARFKDVLKNGIEIAGRTYTFLGFSHSSLRSHSVWFSAPFMDDDGHFQTYFSIIKALGNFSNITSPARCAARVGQAFSETPFAVDLYENEINLDRIPDVTSQDGSRVFSDGVGTVSKKAMEHIWDALPHSKGEPSCFQIRLAGAKGMLAVDSRLRDKVVRIRPSMIKFEGLDTRNLEICDVGSKPIRLVLNRQMIKIMEDMGVSETWFFDLQNLHIKQLRKITATTKNTADFIKSQNIAESIRLHKLYTASHSLKIDYKTDDFLRLVVEAVVLRELRLLKHKARIPVKEGITLYGIMDETGFLKENEVYVTFNTLEGRFSSPPGSGRLLVTRSPALYDGDIQFAWNVIPPDGHPLLNHQNCIVFSQHGARDLPSQLSGGDLDGDIFSVIWDPEATPLRTFAAADYPRVDPLDIGRPVTKEDMAEFFVDFMKTDHLGIIATKHMILADQKKEGTCHTDCKKLAQLHSTAVDFSKTGIPVELQDMPWILNYRPDFLAPGPQSFLHEKSEIELQAPTVQKTYNEDEDNGPPHKYYKSEKILGKLYRAVDERKIWHEDVRIPRQRAVDRPVDFWESFFLSCVQKAREYGQISWSSRVDEAGRIRSAYEDAIFSAMNNFSEHPIHPISELEVFIGHILNKTGSQTHRQRERSIKLKDEFDRIASWITKQLRKYGNGPIPLTGYETELDALELCLAAVHVGGERKRTSRRKRDGKGELKSFRVVAACALLAELELWEKGERGTRIVAGGIIGLRS